MLNARSVDKWHRRLSKASIPFSLKKGNLFGVITMGSIGPAPLSAIKYEVSNIVHNQQRPRNIFATSFWPPTLGQRVSCTEYSEYYLGSRLLRGAKKSRRISPEHSGADPHQAAPYSSSCHTSVKGL